MAQLSCGVQCSRLILFIFNVLFVVCGIILLGFGIFVKVSKRFDIVFPERLTTKIVGGDAIEWVGTIMIIVASVTILLAALGCLGAVFKNRVFLYFYALILSFLIITEIGALVVTLNSRLRVRDSYESGFRELFIEVYSNNHTDLQYIIEDMEREFKCCGVQNVTDYYEHNYIVPASCHEDENFHKPIFDQGCADAAINWVWKQFPIIGGALSGVLLIEIFGVIFSVALGIAISHSSSYDEIYMANG